MTRLFSYRCLRVAGLASAVVQVALAQQCYYPNGKNAPDSEKPCSSEEGSACCPDKWECLDNGLCHYEPNNLYGRYSCTDKSWKSPGCASNMCTYDMTAIGGESITQCSDHDNKWCCNADNQNVNCCKESPSPRPFFVLQDGKAYATIGQSTASSAPNLASITMLASGSGSGSSSSTKGSSSSPSPSPTESSSTESSTDSSSSPSVTSSTEDGVPSRTTLSSTPVTSTLSSVSSGSAGLTTIVSTITTQAPASSSTTTPSEITGEKSKTPIIIGCAVGIPLAIALVGILFWLFRKRANQKKEDSLASDTPDPYANGTLSPEFAGGVNFSKPMSNTSAYNGASTYKPDVPELAGQSIGTGRPVSIAVKGVSELGTGSGFVSGTTPHAPHLLGVGGGNGQAHSPQSSWGSAPPNYSPGANQNNWAPGHAQQPSVDSTQGGGVAVAQTGGGRYIPYRPPGHPAAMPQMSELPVNIPHTIPEMGPGRSPPAAAELRSGQLPPTIREVGPGRNRPA